MCQKLNERGVALTNTVVVQAETPQTQTPQTETKTTASKPDLSQQSKEDWSGQSKVVSYKQKSSNFNRT